MEVFKLEAPLDAPTLQQQFFIFTAQLFDGLFEELHLALMPLK